VAKKGSTTKATAKKGSTAKKSIKAKKAQTDKKNVKNTIEQVVESNRQIKYKYPEDLTDTVKRKKFRQIVRNKLRKYERELADLTGKAKVKLNTEYQKYRKEVLLVP
jgi:hypothetical protein